MPALPIPLPAVPWGGEQPVSGTADVRGALPTDAQALEPEDAPVREAFVELVTETQLEYQVASSYAAAQSDITRATGLYQDGLCADRGVFRGPGESNDALRARTLSTPALVTPEAILAAANAILAPHTTVEAQLFESILDRLFLSDGTASWHSFLWAATPQDNNYADRRYDTRHDAHPGNSWVFDDSTNGRYFVLRVPVLGNVSNAAAFLFQGDLVDGAWIGDGSNTSGAEADGSVATFLYADAGDALDIYARIVAAVEAIRGHGIRWKLYVDPNLH